MIGDRIEVNIAGGLDIPLPRMVHMRQKFKTTRIDNVSQAVADQFKRPEVRSTVKPGMTIALGVRQPRHRQHRRVREAGGRRAQGAGRQALHRAGHGQPRRRHRRRPAAGPGRLRHHRELRRLPDPLAAWTWSSSGKADGIPVYFDKLASAADHVAGLPRSSRTPTSARPIESGLIKMMIIGLGKITGATELHTYGMDTSASCCPRPRSSSVARRTSCSAWAWSRTPTTRPRSSRPCPPSRYSSASRCCWRRPRS